MAAPNPSKLKYSIVYKYLNFLPILIKFVSKFIVCKVLYFKKGKRKVKGVPQSQTAALPRPKEEEETDKSKQAQTEQKYEKHLDFKVAFPFNYVNL